MRVHCNHNSFGDFFSVNEHFCNSFLFFYYIVNSIYFILFYIYRCNIISIAIQFQIFSDVILKYERKIVFLSEKIYI